VRSMVAAVMLAAAIAPVAARQPKYRVKATADKHTSFSALRTYAWMPGWTALQEPVDEHIVSAIDRELARLGFVKHAQEPADVIVTYAALQRTDVDLKTKLSDDPEVRREYRVGTLIVLLRRPDTFRDLFRARGDTPLAGDPAAIAGQIDTMVAEMFEQYPTRHEKHGRSR
jgi:uncharacterized protein DUF4136